MAAAVPATLNGVDLDQLVGTVRVVAQQADLARFRFRATTEWLGGLRAGTTVRGFLGAGIEDDSRAEPFRLEADEPPVLFGSNAGPSAVEALLHALGSCLAARVACRAAADGIEVRRLAFDLEGDLDLHGLMGLPEATRPGYDAIRVTCRVDADAPRERIERLLADVERTSPVLDVVRNPVPVTLGLEPAEGKSSRLEG